MNLDDIKQIFEDCELDGNKIILKSNLHEAVELVMKKYNYDILKEMTAVDKSEGQTELIYHLYTTTDEEDLFLSITVNGKAETITDLFKSAVADEREIYDLFGVIFTGHDDLK